MGRTAMTTIEEIDAAIREMDRPASQAEIAEHLDVPRNRVKQRLHRDGDEFEKTSAGAYYPKGLKPALLSAAEWAVVEALRKQMAGAP